MASTPITHFDLDPDKLAVIREWMEHYDVGQRAVVGRGLIGVPVMLLLAGLLAKKPHPAPPSEM